MLKLQSLLHEIASWKRPITPAWYARLPIHRNDHACACVHVLPCHDIIAMHARIKDLIYMQACMHARRHAMPCILHHCNDCIRFGNYTSRIHVVTLHQLLCGMYLFSVSYNDTHGSRNFTLTSSIMHISGSYICWILPSFPDGGLYLDRCPISPFLYGQCHLRSMLKWLLAINPPVPPMSDL